MCLFHWDFWKKFGKKVHMFLTFSKVVLSALLIETKGPGCCELKKKVPAKIINVTVTNCLFTECHTAEMNFFQQVLNTEYIQCRCIYLNYIKLGCKYTQGGLQSEHFLHSACVSHVFIRDSAPRSTCRWIFICALFYCQMNLEQLSSFHAHMHLHHWDAFGFSF